MNTFKHLKRVFLHRHYVFINCCRAGIPIRGLLHDLSKFSPTELFESIAYYDDKLSPCDNMRKLKGYSYGRLHHKGRNKHHWEYWVDIVHGKMVPVKMPYKYMVEMLCDWIGAEKAYRGTKSLRSQFDYWKAHESETIMHPVTKSMVSTLLNVRANSDDESVFYQCMRDDWIKKIYNKRK